MHNASVYRFGEFVAVHLGDGSTQYLDRASAWELTKAMRKVCKSIDREKFTESECGTVSIEYKGRF